MTTPGITYNCNVSVSCLRTSLFLGTSAIPPLVFDCISESPLFWKHVSLLSFP
jgi:hypothetical protein